MAKTKAQIIAEAQVVKNATEVGENTATRVGTVLEDLADADSVVIIPVTGTESGGSITLSSNPFTQVQTAVNAGQHVVVRVTVGSDIVDFTMNTYSASVATYIGTANFLQQEFQLLCSSSGATITNRSTSNTFSTGESVPSIGIDATPTQGSDNLVKSGGVWEEEETLRNFDNFVINGGVTATATIKGSNVHERIFVGLTLEPNITYHLTATAPTAFSATFHIRLYDSVGTQIFASTIATGSLSADVYYMPTQRYVGAYMEVWVQGSSNVGKTVTITLENGSRSVLGIQNRISQTFGKDTQLLRIVGNGTGSKSMEFVTQADHIYRIYIVNKAEWSVGSFSPSAVAAWAIDGYNTSWYNYVTINLNVFSSLPDYLDITATSTRARIVIRADANEEIFFEIVDITNSAIRSRLDDAETQLESIASTPSIESALDTALNSIGSFTIAPTLRQRVWYRSEYFHLKLGKAYRLIVSASASLADYIQVAVTYGASDTTLAATRVEAGETSAIGIYRTGIDLLARLSIYTPMTSSQILESGFSFQFEEINDDAYTRSAIANSPAKYGRYLCHLFTDNGSIQENIVIPFESVYDIEIAHRLGFQVIEGNVHKTSDDKFVVLHGDNGTFGGMFQHVDGVTDVSSVSVSSVSLEWIKTNVRFKSKYAKYRTAISTLEEWLRVVKKYNMIPLVQIVNPAEYDIIESVFAKDNYIAYNGNRIYTSAAIFSWRSASSISDVIGGALSVSTGLPYFFGINQTSRNAMTDAELVALVDAAHKENVWMSTAYVENEAINQKLVSAGFDFISATWQIPPFAQGNLCDICGSVSFEQFTHDGSVSDGVLGLVAGNTIAPATSIPTVFLGACLLSIRFSGTITLTMGKIANNQLTSDGTEPMLITSYALEQSPSFLITANGSVNIYDITFKSSAR